MRERLVPRTYSLQQPRGYTSRIHRDPLQFTSLRFAQPTAVSRRCTEIAPLSGIDIASRRETTGPFRDREDEEEDAAAAVTGSGGVLTYSKNPSHIRRVKWREQKRREKKRNGKGEKNYMKYISHSRFTKLGLLILRIVRPCRTELYADFMQTV